MERRIVYPCRGQPFHYGHVATIFKFWDSYPMDNIIVGLISNQIRDRRNPFINEEPLIIATMVLEDSRVSNIIEVKMLESPGMDAGIWIRNLLCSCQASGILTGNERMAKLAGSIEGLKVYNPQDGEASNIRSSEIRRMIAEGEDGWKNMMTESAVGYILGLNINWNGLLPEARKPDWWHD